MPQIGSDLFALSYTRQAIMWERRAMFDQPQRCLPLLTGTVLLVRIKPLGGHRWIEVSRKNVHRN
jgi:hypothetical protein